MATTKRSQPEWRPPRTPEVSLKLYNSLTRSKQPFAPADGRVVKSYICGPTVYDASHMGHARSYISFDIVRRVLQDYFHYKVYHVMNVTDIDDKIILRARQEHLYAQYAESSPLPSAVLEDVAVSLAALAVKMEKETDQAKKDMYAKILREAEAARAALERDPDSTEASAQLLAAAKTPLSQWLDKEKGAEITSLDIFAKLYRHWEEQFMLDMQALGVMPPDCLTRVSEYVPEIVAYVQRIMDNGYAYETQGSVYFDVAAFDNHDGHHYAKLVPESVGSLEALAEGEGELATGDGKKAPQDFALWKKSKPGEPCWDSPWGKGRPGWHIECSAMASDVLGETLDIHCGGIDLMFPHHDNEIAQAEAYYNNDQWVNFFLHAGHLEIEGRKMSKSLKNFITIQEALQRYTPRQLRLMFLMHSWTATLDYSDSTMASALHTERLFNEFFLNVKAAVRKAAGPGKPGTQEKALAAKIIEAQASVHDALCDSIDTPTAIKALKAIVTEVNLYLGSAPLCVDAALLVKAAAFVTDILTIFGVIDKAQSFGFPSSASTEQNAEEIILPYVEALSEFRDSVRNLGMSRAPKDTQLLDLCGQLRDDVLPQLGVRLEDKGGESAVVKLVDKDQLLKERAQALELQAAKDKAKEEARRKKEEAEKKKLEQAKIDPRDMFRDALDKDGKPLYSAFDDKGLPTHDGEGVELSKSRRKKLEGEQKKQATLHSTLGKK